LILSDAAYGSPEQQHPSADFQKLGQIQSAFANAFSDLHQNVSRLVADKTFHAIENSHDAPIRSSVAAAWMRLRPTLRALEKAATREPGRVRYWAQSSALDPLVGA
jgi:hypothetical protein